VVVVEQLPPAGITQPFRLLWPMAVLRTAKSMASWASMRISMVPSNVWSHGLVGMVSVALPEPTSVGRSPIRWVSGTWGA
jgi:hypothetical protein